MRQARSNFDRKRRSEPSSSFIIIYATLSFVKNSPLWGQHHLCLQECWNYRVTGLVKKKIKKGSPT
jgi:hypothetical protein